MYFSLFFSISTCFLPVAQSPGFSFSLQDGAFEEGGHLHRRWVCLSTAEATRPQGDQMLTVLAAAPDPWVQVL
jgi:hypothetical protein